jgi:hypothetical protein
MRPAFSDYNLDLMQAADTLVNGEGDPLLAFGSMTTWNDLLAAVLIDELPIMVGAGVLVDGVPAFSVRPPGPMRLVAARHLDASNIALLLYRWDDCRRIVRHHSL